MSTLNTLKTVVNQAESTAKNTVSNAVASARRGTGITDWANSLLANTTVHQERIQRGIKQRRDKTGVYVLSEEEARASSMTGGVVFTAPDGYIRKSPVQEIVIAPDYNQKRLKKAVLFALGTAAVVLALYALIFLKVINL